MKLASGAYAAHRRAVEAVAVTEPAVPLVPADDREAARSRATREVAAGADAVVVKPGLETLDLVSLIASSADRPVVAYFTADEHAFFYANENLMDAAALEREGLAAARRAGAELIVSHAALDVAEA